MHCALTQIGLSLSNSKWHYRLFATNQAANRAIVNRESASASNLWITREFNDPPRTVLTIRQKKLQICFPSTELVISLALFGTGYCVNWNTLNATQLSNLPASDFATITPEQLASIPVGACIGFRSDQVNAIPDASIAALAAAQLLWLNPLACAGFKASQLASLQNTTGDGLIATCLTELPPLSCSGLKAGFVAQADAQTFVGWTKQCVANSPGDIFSLINLYDLSNLNNEACGGLNSSHIKNMPAEAASGLRGFCVNNFDTTTKASPCAGFQADFLSGIGTDAFSSLSAACIKLIPSAAFTLIQAGQLKFINPNSCPGLTANQVYALPETSASGMTSACLQNMANACSGLMYNFVGSMTPNAFTGFTADCIEVTNEEIFTLIRTNQLTKIPPAAFAGFNTQLKSVSNFVIQAASLDQLLNLSPYYSNLGGMTANQLGIVSITLGTDLIYNWTISQTYKYPMASASYFKFFIPTIVKNTNWTTWDRPVSQTTWLQLALLDPKLSKDLDSKFMTELPPSAVMGLRMDQVQHMAPAVFSLLNTSQASYLINDTASALNGTQLMQIPATAFGVISPYGISGLQPLVIPNITNAQINNMTVAQVKAMSCDQLLAFVPRQGPAFQPQVGYKVYQLTQNCKGAPVSAPVMPPVKAPIMAPVSAPVKAPVSAPVMSPVKAPVMPPVRAPVMPPVKAPIMSPVMSPVKSPVNTPSHNVTVPTPSAQPGGLSKFALIAIIGGTGAVISAVVVGLVFWCKKRSNDPERRGLLSNPNEDRYERV